MRYLATIHITLSRTKGKARKSVTPPKRTIDASVEAKSGASFNQPSPDTVFVVIRTPFRFHHDADDQHHDCAVTLFLAGQPKAQ